ncbi:hypothetical protein GDO81_018724 [Engystomops pustulosus]|uniref:Uncharacterized protein n=1 Tax=Engystomops pustulosus TaxID=76066 RepID=A0AAV6YTM4_ENGPU|nr:hypothetical protein GDO81_018724 [Engystomops pustulosus]
MFPSATFSRKETRGSKRGCGSTVAGCRVSVVISSSSSSSLLFTSLACVLWCLRRSEGTWKPLPHCGHVWGRTSLWILWCFFSPALSTNPL